MPYAEREEQTAESPPLRRFDVLQDLVCQHRSHPLQAYKLLLGERVDVPRVLDQPVFEQVRYPLLAQPLDVYDGRKMAEPAEHLRRAGDVRAVAHRLAFGTIRLAAADRPV